MRLYGGIEGGGTKFVCAVAEAPDRIIDEVRIPTASPDETLRRAVDFFRRHEGVEAVGIASFGPLDLAAGSPTYGSITTTPKPGWQNVNILRRIKDELHVPAAIDTDVNGAALGEQRYGAGRGLHSLAYVTAGTGIGAGSIVNNQLLKGLTHTELGHILIPRLAGDDKPSACSYHASCFEGLASGTALHRRWGQPAAVLGDSGAWEQEAAYLAYGLANLVLATMPQRIILGGGVMEHPGLLENVRAKVAGTLNGYVRLPVLTDQIADYIVAPELGERSGVTGALVLAAAA